MKKQKRVRRKAVVDQDFLDELWWIDFVRGITDPEHLRIAGENGLLKWTPRWKKLKMRAYAE